MAKDLLDIGFDGLGSSHWDKILLICEKIWPGKIGLEVWIITPDQVINRDSLLQNKQVLRRAISGLLYLRLRLLAFGIVAILLITVRYTIRFETLVSTWNDRCCLRKPVVEDL